MKKVEYKYPTTKYLKKVLELHGLNEDELRGISILDSEESDRVGYAWRGCSFSQLMEGIEETLDIKNMIVRFSKIEECKGIIYVRLKS